MEARCCVERKLDKNRVLKQSCFVESATINKPNTEIKIFKGIDPTIKFDATVKLVFEDLQIEYFPRNLHKTFPHLTQLHIRKCGMKAISRRDFVGLENLERIDLDGNELTSLPRNLFTYMRDLKKISFAHNQIEIISTEMFKPFVGRSLKLVDFTGNKNLDFAMTELTDFKLHLLISAIQKGCKEPSRNFRPYKVCQREKLMKALSDQLLSGQLSDFVIKVGTREFRVHKDILAIQSPVFCAMFDSDMETIDEIRMDEFSVGAVEEMLNFLYTGEIKDEKTAMEVFEIAANFDIVQLKLTSENIIVENFDSSFAFEILKLGTIYDSSEMKELAFQEIASRFTNRTIPKSLKDEPELLQKLAIAAAELHRKNKEAKEAYKRATEEAEKEFSLLYAQIKKNFE